MQIYLARIGFVPTDVEVSFMNRLILVIIGILMAIEASSFEEHGDRKYRKQGLHNGNLVETLFWNFGEVAWWGKQPSGVWPRGTGHSYMDGITPMVAAEVVLSDGDTIHIVEAGYREHYEVDPITGVEYGWQPIPGYSNPYEDKIAMSDAPDSWPPFWPDKMDDPNDPGWSGCWNGYFGKRTNADQESYFVMDDYCDYGAAFCGRVYCDRYDSLRGGLGMRVEVRGFQWSNVLAEDLIFWHYDITNVSTTHYDKTVFGMYVDCGIGGQFDSNDDNAFYDTEMDITYSWDANGLGEGGWGPTGYAGYAFLESPGNPYNGIDDDGDGRDGPGPVITPDVFLPRSYSVGKQCVVIDYNTYERKVVSMSDTGVVVSCRGEARRIMPGEILVEIDWNGMDDNLNGLIDENREMHMGLKYKDWVTGEGLDNLLIDEARDDGIDNDGDWNPETDDLGADGVPGTGDRGEGDGIPTSGEPHFDETDKDESDQIGLTAFDCFYIGQGVEYQYDEVIWERIANYHFDTGAQNGNIAFLYGSGPFPLPPGKTERFSLALVFGNDLEDLRRNVEVVQKIYNANYNFARPPDKPKIRAVAGDGKVTLYWDDIAEQSEDPFADSTNCEQGIYGWKDFEGYRIYRSTDPAFNDCYTITDGQGNPILYQPLAQFDIKNNVSGYFPIAVNGVHYYMGDNTGIRHSYTDYDVKNGQTYYYAVVSYDRGWAEAGILPSECTKVIKMDVAGNVALDKNTVVVTPRSPAAGYKAANVDIVHTGGPGTGDIWIDILDPLKVRDNEYRIIFDDTTDDTTRYSLYDLASDSMLFTSTCVNGKDFNPVFDGIRLYVRDDTVSWNDSLTGWIEGECNLIIIVEQLSSFPRRRSGYPTSYEIRIDTFGVDTSYLYSNPRHATNFEIWDVVDSQKVRYYLWEPQGEADSMLNAGDYIDTWLWVDDYWQRVWRIKFYEPGIDTTINPIQGDRAYIAVNTPFRSGDVFDIETRTAHIDKVLAKNEMDRIAVVPNPYCAAAEWEPRRLLASGRGERRIYFIHLPQKATIRIYTTSGELIRVIEHISTVDDGEEPWDLISKDGIGIAPGIYIYHVDAPGIGEKLGRFAIIK